MLGGSGGTGGGAEGYCGGETEVRSTLGFERKVAFLSFSGDPAFFYFCSFRVPQVPTAVPGDDSKTRVFLHTHPGAKSIFTDGLRVPAGYTESVLLTFPPYKTASVSARSPDLDLNISYEKRY